MSLNEADVENATLSLLGELGYTVDHGPRIAPGETTAERDSFSDVVLVGRLRKAIRQLNPAIPEDAREEALRKVLRVDAASLISNNRAFHRMLRDGVEVEYQRPDGSIAGDRVRLVSFADTNDNDWLAVNQFTVREGQHHRRLDIVVLVNGLPLALFELKSATDEGATIWTAHTQFQTYKAELPSLLRYNELLVITDGLEARLGSLTASQEWFKIWRTIDGETDAPMSALELEVLLRGVFPPRRLLDLLEHFIVFDEDPDSGAVHKIVAGYHQFHAVNAAVEETVRASGMGQSGSTLGGQPGDRRAGVVWHTQGSGKSFSMLFFAARLVRHPPMQNPTIVVLTDRNDLDDQLFGQFQRCHEILGQMPVQAGHRDHLRALLQVASGGVVFTTIQKFLPAEKGGRMPELSPRRNIVVIADEAHRSQYDLIDGLARNLRDALPNASFIGFTGTPIEKKDANTRAIFGDYISVYDIQRAVADKATVPIYYESRIAKLGLNAAEVPKIDAEFEEITEGEEETSREKLKSKWAAIEALVGHPKRIKLIAADLVAHFEKRLEAMDGKAMIVCMRRALANRFKDSKDPFRIVIVRDMWLTGFDAPCLHTMYVDKPMHSHGLMQAIARVNRVFRDKPGGLVVDYLGLADQLKEALATYTESGGQGSPTYDTRQAIAVMLEKHNIASDMLHGFKWDKWTSGKPMERLALIPAGQELILQQKDGKQRFVKVVTELSRAFALCAASDEATEIRDDVSFFQALQAALNKQSGGGSGKTPEQLNAAVRQLVSKAIVTEGQVIDVFTAAGLPKPDISILSDQFLAEVRGLKHKNVAAELLEKLLKDELKIRSRRNLVQSQLFSEKLKKTLNAYHNRAIATHEVIEELIKLAKEMAAAARRGTDLGLNDDEVAFYDALAANESAVTAMGDDKLKVIATALIAQIRKSVTIDWTLRESARAKIRVMVKRILNKFGYPPDLQEEAVKTVLKQAELLCADWAPS